MAAGVAFSSWAAGDGVSIVSDPSPVVATRPVSITITTSDFGSEVYLYTWAVTGSGGSKEAASWSNANVEKYRMSGSNGVYSYTLQDIKSFYSLSDSEVSDLAKIGFIAKTKNGKQTEDCFVNVIQAPVQKYSGGSGTAADPYILATTADLKDLSTAMSDWDKCFKMEADIVAAGITKPVGDKANPFKGVFDGNGKNISSLNLTSTTFGEGTGLFGTVGEGAEIRDLGVIDATINGMCFTGILAGYVNGGTISRCYSTGTVKATSICVGGLVGENGGTISDCYSVANVDARTDYAVGGLVGKNTGSIARTIASGDVAGYDYVGGLVGANYGRVSNSVAVNGSIASSNNYVARFGGNNNGRNISQGNFVWDLIAPENGSWTRHGDHATAKKSNELASESTYKSITGWDFDNVWVWRVEPVRASIAAQGPVLRSFGESQPYIFPEELFNTISGVEVVESDGVKVSVSPNPTEGLLSVSAPAPVTSAQVFSLGGQLVASVDGGESKDVTLDMTDCAAGVYLLHVEMAGTAPVIIKVIKK